MSSVAAGGSSKPSTPIAVGGKPRRGRGSAGGSADFTMVYGSRKLKAYPITDDELERLSELGFGAGVCSSFAAALLGFAIDVHKDLSLASGLAAGVHAEWSTWRTASIIGAALMAAASFYLLYRKRTKLQSFKTGTIFANAP